VTIHEAPAPTEKTAEELRKEFQELMKQAKKDIKALNSGRRTDEELSVRDLIMRIFAR
jgi:ribosomal protein L17